MILVSGSIWGIRSVRDGGGERGVAHFFHAIVEAKESKPSTVKEGGTQVPTSQKQSASWLTGTW